MNLEFYKFQQFSNNVMLYGQEVIQGLIILVVGLLLIKLVPRYLKPLLRGIRVKETWVSVITNAVYVLLLALVVSAACHHAGMRGIVIMRVLGAVSIALVGLIIIFRPLFPTLPFKVGNTVKAGGVLGKVEAITILNTRIKSFDGRTVFIPNRMILNDVIENYHFTPSRQIRLVMGIRYDSDLMNAKKIISEIIARDPRVLDAPAARVFVLNLTDSCVEIAARPWVENVDYWRTRCDLLEVIKLSFDREGIAIAFQQRDVHVYNEMVEAEDSRFLSELSQSPVVRSPDQL